MTQQVEVRQTGRSIAMPHSGTILEEALAISNA